MMLGLNIVTGHLETSDSADKCSNEGSGQGYPPLPLQQIIAELELINQARLSVGGGFKIIGEQNDRNTNDVADNNFICRLCRDNNQDAMAIMVCGWCFIFCSYFAFLGVFLMSESTELSTTVSLEPSNAVVLFAGGLDEALAKIAKELRAGVSDISTEKGRKEIASRARKAASCKVKIDEMGKDLNEEANKKIAAINADRNKAKKFLDDLRDEIRKPLDDYEAKEEKRIADHEEAIKTMESASVITAEMKSEDIDTTMHSLDEMWRARDWEEFAMRAENVARTAFDKLKTALDAAKKYEADQADLARLRAEAAERERIEREKEIAEKAANAARIAAEAEAARKAKEAAEEAERILKAQKESEDRALREARDAEDRARMAEARRVADAEKAELDRIAAEEKAKRDQEASVQAERDRAAAAKKKEEDETAARESDKKIRAKIHNEARQGLMALDCVLGEIPAKAIVVAIAQGKIPHVKIIY